MLTESTIVEAAVLSTDSDPAEAGAEPAITPRRDGQRERGDGSARRHRTAGRRSSLYGLTPRETAVLELLGEGLSNEDIASRLGVSLYTASKHVSNIVDKMHADSRAEVQTRARQDQRLDERD